MQKKLFLFQELSEQAKEFAINDYIQGWEETHPKGDMSLKEVKFILDNEDMLYTVDGDYVCEVGEEDEIDL